MSPIDAETRALIQAEMRSFLRSPQLIGALSERGIPETKVARTRVVDHLPRAARDGELAVHDGVLWRSVAKQWLPAQKLGATVVFANARPPSLNVLPAGSFTTSQPRADVLLVASGTGYGAVAGEIGLSVKVDGVARLSLHAFANTAGTHQALPTGFGLAEGLARGAHTLTLERLAQLNADGNDFFNLLALELPTTQDQG